MKNTDNDPKFFSSRSVPLLALALVVTAITITLAFREGLPPSAKPQTVVRTGTPAAAPSVNFDQETAALIGAPRSYTPTAAKASALREVIKKGDFASAGKAIRESLQQSRIQDWHMRPFNKLITGALQGDDAAILNRINEWAARDKDSATPYLLRAQYHYNTGWLVRGERFAAEIQAGRLASFQAHMEHAAADVAEAMRRDGADPYATHLWLRILSGQGNTPEMEAAFQQSIRKFPDYYPLYLMRLRTLSPKWGGSPKEMYAFVDTYAGKADAYSPLKLLYLQLYANFLDMARIACSDKNGDALSQCIGRDMSKFITGELETNVYNALQLYNHVDKYQFTLEVGNILLDMVRTEGGERYAGSLLQLAADSMGSNNQLPASDTRNNNFMMDRLTGKVWYRKGHYENAEKMAMRAIADIPNTAFPNEEERDIALAELYDQLAGVYGETAQFEKIVVYQTAADALGGAIRPGRSHLKCNALFRLKRYDDAIKDCTAQFEGGSDIESVFWRARAYDASGQTELALHDFRLVADSDNEFRTYSAIQISVIYARNNDVQHMLETLNAYGFLYDEAHQEKKDIAIAYNNRCYAKMHLGNLHDALKDCTTSLRYDSLPDAYQKQQELVRRLKEKEA